MSNIVQVGGKVYIDGEEINIPRHKYCSNITQIDGKTYIDGYELVNGKWKRTLKGLFHLIF